MISLTVTHVSHDGTYIDLNLEVNSSVYQIKLTADYYGIYWLAIDGKTIYSFPAVFTISEYHNRSLIKWICDKAYQLSTITCLDRQHEI